MNDIARTWTRLGELRRLRVRYWFRSPWGFLGALLKDSPWWGTLGFEIRTLRWENGSCYCPTGSQTELWLNLLGSGLIVWFSRDPTTRPCYCEQVVAEMFPEADLMEDPQRFPAGVPAPIRRAWSPACQLI